MSAIPIPDPPASAVPGMKRVRRHKWLTWPVILGAIVVLAWVITAATAQYWAPYDPLDFVGKRLQPPSAQHWFGTDGLGRDVFTRTLYGASHSIPIAVIVVLVGAFIGVALGAIAGFFGGLADSAIMRAVDVTLSFPPVLLAMAVTASLGPSLTNAGIAMVIVWWPVYARLMRAQVIAVKGQEHVEAAIAGGASWPRLLLGHILPLCWSPVADQRHDGFRAGGAAGRLAQLHRPRRAAAGPGMGLDDLRGRRALLLLVDRRRTGRRHPQRGAGLQFPRRRAARHPRPPERGMSAAPILEVRDLEVFFATSHGSVEAVRGVDLTLAAGDVLGIVGESGSGKSVTMRAVLGLLPPTARIRGSVRFHGQELLGRSRRLLRALRGKRIGMIFQDPMTALNPVITIGEQIVEAIRIHDRAISHSKALARAVELLELVAIPFPERRVRQYPHEFSGGMRQRAVIAMAMANGPELLIADEPTTALDVTVQAQILDVLARLRVERGVSLALITHDLGVVAGMADHIAVMYAGRVVERGPVNEVFYRPRHPYTRGLLAATPRIEGEVVRLRAIEGSPPSLARRPSGCAFHPRCPLADGRRCVTEEPVLREVDGAFAACHYAEAMPSLVSIDPDRGEAHAG